MASSDLELLLSVGLGAGVAYPVVATFFVRNSLAEKFGREQEEKWRKDGGPLYWLFRGFPGEKSRGSLAFARGGVFACWALVFLLLVSFIAKLFGVTL